jgi:UDP-glucuronate decarboxylase
MIELAQKVIKLTDSSSQLVYQDLPEDDPLQRQPIIDMAKKELGWEPHIALEEGLKKTIEYFRGVLND